MNNLNSIQFNSTAKRWDILQNTDCWIISGCKRQGQMKQEVRNVGKFSASTPSSGSNYLLLETRCGVRAVRNNEPSDLST